ncbi:hypothetical protein PHYBOEH_011041 [Phytophthora boehmeriae]|uniref:Uncharacterized protein n=1 Tax=Phytophthora boehmeriae TaxID=109152 RepID=A0A8T1X6C2_9STRA|nr:hypothetical protein PHYBOEH_011041 [Phytophthora boehmeriae]
MEVLTRSADAPRGPPRVLVDSSMSLSFSIPASFLRARQTAPTAVKIQQSSIASSSSTQTGPNAQNRTDIPSNDVDASWEERDWETEDLQDTIADGQKQDHAQETEDWEQETTPDLPDDFPRLIVNLTRVQQQHFPPEKGETDEDMMQVFQRVKTTLHEHFSQLAEVLFEQKSCFHCTYGTSRGMMDGLHAAYPDDTFAMVDYPTVIDDIPLHEYLHTLSYPSQWKSVEYLKDCLRRCSRDIKWKTQVITELEVLAEQEHARYLEEQQSLSDEIDELTRLRDSFRDKLEKIGKQDGKRNGEYLLLRKLEDIENRLVTLLDSYLKEAELEEAECYGAFGVPNGETGPSTGMNVLDMVIAMIFGRLPRDFSQKNTSEEHYQMLFDHHIHILRLWKKDFGRLPSKNRESAPRPDDSNVVDLHESSCEENGAANASYGEEEQVDSFASHFQVDSGVSGDEVVSPSTVDDWETVDIEDNSHTEEDTITIEVEHGDSDGYGADFDSDESEDEDEVAAATKLKQQTLDEVKSSVRTKAVASARPRRRRIKRSKRAKRLEKRKSKRHESDEERDTAPFQPFACTGAVGLLRLAKENELF